MVRTPQSALVGLFFLAVAGVFIACTTEESPPKRDGSSSGGAEPDSGSPADAASPTEAAATKTALGETCPNDDACESGHCFAGGDGGGGGSTEGKCTIPCAVKSQNKAPECVDKPGLTGKCNGKNFCQPVTEQ